VQQHALRQRHRHRVSSDASDCLSDEDTEGCFSDDGSLGAASDSTSISVPAAATAALAEQLQHSTLQDEAATNRQAALLLQQAPQRPQQQQAPHEQQQVEQQQPLQQQHSALRHLRICFAAVDSLTTLLELCPGLTDLQLDGPALNIQAAAAACPNIKRLAYLVGNPHELDAALFYLNGMGSLRGLELEIKGMMLSTEQLRVSFGSSAALTAGPVLSISFSSSWVGYQKRVGRRDHWLRVCMRLMFCLLSPYC
jgi:hypothetical protein